MPRDWSFPLLALLVLLPPLGLLPGCDRNDSGMNQAPQAELTVTPQSGTAPVLANAEIDGSDPDGTVEQFQADTNYTGTFTADVTNNTSLDISATYNNNATFAARVIDNDDKASPVTTREITIGQPVRVDQTTATLGTFNNTDATTSSTIDAEAYSTLTNGNEAPADSSFPSIDGTILDTLTNKRNFDITIPDKHLDNATHTIALRATTTRNGDTETATTEKDIRFTVPDTTAPSFTEATASEPDDNYGTVAVTAETDEQSDITLYLKNQAGTDSTQVAQRSNTQTLDLAVDALLFDYTVGDTAQLSIQATDQNGNTNTDYVQATIEGSDYAIHVKRASSEPSKGLIPQQATITIVNDNGEKELQTQTDQQGNIQLPNLAQGDTIKANDELTDQIGELYETNITVSKKQDAERTIGMLENIALQQGDDYYAHSLDLLFDAQNTLGEPRLQLPPDDDFQADSVEDIYPMTFAINQNDRYLPDDHRQAIKNGILSWNGTNGNYNHTKMIDDTTEADWTVRLGDGSKGVNFDKRVIILREPTDVTPPIGTQKVMAHEPYHALKMGLGTDSHLKIPEYIGNTTFGDDNYPTETTKTEVKLFNSLIQLRKIYDTQRKLNPLFDAE